MEKAIVLIFIGLLVFLAHLFVQMFEKTKVPDILYLIIIGVIIGPILKLIRPEDFGKVGHIFSTVALVVILFEGGLETSFELLKKAFRGTMLLSIASFFITAALLSAIFYFFKFFDLKYSILISSILAGPAPAIVIPLSRQLKLSDKAKTTLTLESVLGEALCILITLAIFESIEMNEMMTGKAIGRIFSSFFVASVLGIAAGYFWSIILNKVRELRNAIFTTPAFTLILYGLCDLLGFSGPIGVLAFGVTLCNVKLIKIPILSERIKLNPIEHNEIEKMFFGEIVFMLKTFFFVYLGLSIQFTNMFSFFTAILIIAVILLTRIISVLISTERKSTTKWEAGIMSVMISKGLATAVLASIFVEKGFDRGEYIQSVIYNTILLSVILTSLYIFLLEKTKLKTFSAKLFRKYSDDNAV